MHSARPPDTAPPPEAPRPGVGAAFRREWRLLAGSTWLQSLHLFLPVLALLAMWAVFSPQVLRDLPIVVVDADQTPASRQLVRLLDAAPGIRVAREEMELAAAQAAVRRLEAYGLVHLPRGFEHDLRWRRSPTVTCFYNAQLMSVGVTVEREVGLAVRTFGAQQEAGRSLAAGVPHPGLAARLQPIGVQGTALFNPQQSYEVFLFTAFVPTVLQLFILLGSIRAVGSELRNGTAGEWLKSAGGRLAPALAGKLLLHFLVYALISLGALVTIHGWLGWPLRGSATLVVFGTLAHVAAYQALGVVFVAASGNLRGALSVGAIFAGPAFGFTGVVMPAYTFDWPAQLISHAMPVSTYLRLYAEQAWRAAPASASLPELGVLLLFTVGGLALSGRRLGRWCRDKSKWGAP